MIKRLSFLIAGRAEHLGVGVVLVLRGGGLGRNLVLFSIGGVVACVEREKLE